MTWKKAAKRIHKERLETVRKLRKVEAERDQALANYEAAVRQLAKLRAEVRAALPFIGNSYTRDALEEALAERKEGAT